ncbi:MAG: hypothetical protein ABIA76_04765 [Candidatus Diapherotrites archaeon]
MKKIFLALVLILLSASVFAVSFSLDSYTQEPTSVEAGESFDLLLQIKNTSGDEATNVKISIDPKYPLEIAPGEATEKTIQGLKGGRSSIVKFKLRADSLAAAGEYDLEVSMGSGQTLRKNTIQINVAANEPKIELIDSSMKRIISGSSNEIKLKFKNIGNDPAYDILIEFEEDRTVTTTGEVVERKITPVGSASKYISVLGPGEEKEVSFILSADSDATLKNYVLPVAVEFYDSQREEYSSTAYAGLTVFANAKLDALINSTEPKLYPGGSSELVLDVFNKGSTSAWYTVMELQSENLLIEKNKSFIGTLEEDDFDSIKTTISVPADVAPGNYDLKIVFYYQDNESNEVSAEKNVSLTVLTQTEAMNGAEGGIFETIISLITTLLALIGLFFVGKTIYSKIKK